MKRLIGRVTAVIGIAVVFVLNGARTVLDLIGYSTAVEDAKGVPAFVLRALDWLLSIPSWLTWLTGIVALGWLIWWSWSAPENGTVKPAGKPANTKPTAPSLARELETYRNVFEGFRRRVDGSKRWESVRPVDEIRKYAGGYESVLTSLHKMGFKVPRLDLQVDPLGYLEVAIEYADKVAPLVAKQHMKEAKEMSAELWEAAQKYQAANKR